MSTKIKKKSSVISRTYWILDNILGINCAFTTGADLEGGAPGHAPLFALIWKTKNKFAPPGSA